MPAESGRLGSGGDDRRQSFPEATLVRYALALSTIALVLSATTPGLAADARLPAEENP
jgi:hypothetical protein